MERINAMTSHRGKMSLGTVMSIPTGKNYVDKVNVREGFGDFAHVFGIIPSGECDHGRDLQQADL
jgi:hypothetical protein